MRSRAKAMNYRGVHAIGPGGVNCRCCYDFRRKRPKERRLRRAYEAREARSEVFSALTDIAEEREAGWEAYVQEIADMYDDADYERYAYLDDDRYLDDWHNGYRGYDDYYEPSSSDDLYGSGYEDFEDHYL